MEGGGGPGVAVLTTQRLRLLEGDSPESKVGHGIGNGSSCDAGHARMYTGLSMLCPGLCRELGTDHPHQGLGRAAPRRPPCCSSPRASAAPRWGGGQVEPRCSPC